MTDFFIYNHIQANWMIINGAKAIGCGKGKMGHIYVRFARNEENEKIFLAWKTLKYGPDTRPPKEV